MNLKILAVALFIGISFNACSQKPAKAAQTNQTKGTIELLKPIDFKTRMEKEPGVIIDVRTPNEQAKGVIKNATLLDIFRDDFEAQLDKLDKTKTYYVYCAAGGRSSEACELMQKKGFAKVIDLDGGYTKWKNAGLPVEAKTN